MFTSEVSLTELGDLSVSLAVLYRYYSIWAKKLEMFQVISGKHLTTFGKQYLYTNLRQQVLR